MAVAAETIETYDNKVIKEDLQEAYSMISPMELPFQTAAGKKSVDNTLFEWPVVDLLAPDPDNRVIEGDDAPDIDPATMADRLQNYTQISDKLVSVSHTSEAVDAAADNVQRLKKQIVLKLKELKRDKEIMFLDNVAAVPASSGAARVSAGMQAFLKTNVVAGGGGTNPTLSADPDGYPNAPAGAGTASDLTEDMFNNVIEMTWNSGGEPSMALVNSGNKRVISQTFTGASTRYKDAIDKRLVAAIDVYTSDFGEFQIVPTRFMRPADAGAGDTSFTVLLLDPEYYRIATLESVRQKPLAETGHSHKRLVWVEDGLQVDNEAAHGIIRDTTNVLPTP